ncbi:MAG: 3-dehydroquinate synthase [Chlamydiota bacterium]
MKADIFLGETKVVFCETFFSFFEDLLKLSEPIVFITDHNVKELIGSSIQRLLQEKKRSVFLISIPPGEASKSREIKEWIENELFSIRFPKDGSIIALGGGVVCDMAGFVASTYMRGVSFYSIPTTLLAMVDASIGGKTGINTSFGKNLLGSMYPARQVWICPQFLESLPKREWLNGLSEIMKIGFTLDPELLSLATKKMDQIVIFRSCLAKKQVVDEDYQDRGKRRILQFGHTIGHALEKISSYQLSHGEAVAKGMAIEGFLSYTLGYLSKNKWDSMREILKSCGFSFQVDPKISFSQIQESLEMDKKGTDQRGRFVLLQDFGVVVPFQGEYCTHVDDKVLCKAWEWLKSCPI